VQVVYFVCCGGRRSAQAAAAGIYKIAKRQGAALCPDLTNHKEH